MVNHDAAFLAAIIAAPDDDGPRLLFADWLEEQGDPRGEFIRVQCWLAKCPPELYPTDRGYALRRRERELLEARGAYWCGLLGLTIDQTRLPRIVTTWLGRRVFDSQLTFRRGFVGAVECTAAACMEHMDALLTAAPIREVMLTTWPGVDDVGRRTWRTHPLIGLFWSNILKAEWPRIETWNLPQYGPSLPRGVFSNPLGATRSRSG